MTGSARPGAGSVSDRPPSSAGRPDDAGTPGRWTLLWALGGGAVVWAVHLLVTYVLLAYACTTGRVDNARTILTIASVVAVGLAAWSGVVALRGWQRARRVDRPVDDAWDARMGERTARVSFLMVVGLFSAVVFGIGIVYEAVTIWFVPLCEPGVSP